MTERRRELWSALLVYAATIVACVVLVQGGRFVAVLSPYVGTLVAALFLYLPIWLLSRRGESLKAHGLTHRPLGRGMVVLIAVSLAVFPCYAVGFYLYFARVCGWAQSGAKVPQDYRLLCRAFVADWRVLRLRFPAGFGNQLLGQLVVGLAEETFFRGFLQTRLNRVWPQRWTILWTRVGAAVPVVSLLFALGHLLVDLNPLRLAVFFPSLLFGWMREATCAIWAGAIFHAACNLVNRILYRMVFR